MSRYGIRKEEWDTWIPSAFAKSIYLSDEDHCQLEPMDTYGLPADESSLLLAELSWLHTKNNTRPAPGPVETNKNPMKEAIKEGHIIDVSHMIRPIGEFLKKLKELDPKI
jgi:hypothetical protein